jgi:hypothetical protein
VPVAVEMVSTLSMVGGVEKTLVAVVTEVLGETLIGMLEETLV